MTCGARIHPVEGLDLELTCEETGPHDEHSARLADSATVIHWVYVEDLPCRNCGEPIHQEPSPPPFTPTWVHQDGAVACHIEWAHPTLAPMDNAITDVKVAQP